MAAKDSGIHFLLAALLTAAFMTAELFFDYTYTPTFEGASARDELNIPPNESC